MWLQTTGDASDNGIAMDDLGYAYENGTGNSNQLRNVKDFVTLGMSQGFYDGNIAPGVDDYEYDANGNMIKDRNKGISNITYNHLNLPTQIEFEGTNNKITYLYNAAGQKLEKRVIEGDTHKKVDYLDGFQYAGGVLQFFPHAEGYVKVTPIDRLNTNYAFNYVFNYTDHLGNIRVSYSKDLQTQQLKILEENHYYPFGLKHSVYAEGRLKDFEVDFSNPEDQKVFLNNVTKTEYQYKYNGQEWQDELGLNMYAMDLRQYDPAIGRWVAQDPVTHFDYSPYSAFDNNPVFWADPSGADAESRLKDIFNRSQSGDVWTNDGSGTLTNNRTGESSECDDCDGTIKVNGEQVPLYDKDKYKDVQVMDKIGTIEKIIQLGYKRKWSPDGFTTYLVNDDGFVEGITTTVIGGAGSLEFIGGAGMLLLKVPKYLKYVKKIKTANDLLRYGVKSSKSFELLRTGGKYKAVIEGGAFGAGQYYIQLVKEGWQAVPLSKGGFKLIKDGSEIFFRSSKSGGHKALDTFTLPKAYNGKNVDLFFK